MTAENAGIEIVDDTPPATDRELAELIQAQSAEIERLSAENKGLHGLQGEVEKLQETLGTTKALGDLVTELRAMAAASTTAARPEVSDLQKAADAGDQKAYRKIRRGQMADNSAGQGR